MACKPGAIDRLYPACAMGISDEDKVDEHVPREHDGPPLAGYLYCGVGPKTPRAIAVFMVALGLNFKEAGPVRKRLALLMLGRERSKF